MQSKIKNQKSKIAALLLASCFLLLPARSFAAIKTGIVYSEAYKTLSGQQINRATIVVTGLTAVSSNTVPHGLPRAPRRVWLTLVGNATAGATTTLDDSQGLTDPTGLLAGGHLGWDATNIYIYASTETQVLVNVEY
jgi:hypothetical protein